MNGVWTMPLCAKSFLQRACIWKPVTRIPSAISWLQKGISYNDFKLSFGFTPQVGINGRTAVHGLRMDSLQLDTILFLQ